MNLDELDKAMRNMPPLGYRKDCSACQQNTCSGHDIVGSGINLPRLFGKAGMIIKFPSDPFSEET